MRHVFSWVHVSDIHIGHGSTTYGIEQRLVGRMLLDDLRTLIATNTELTQIDAILVTGDVAFSGAVRSSAEYDRAAVWLDELAGVASLGRDSVYIVPGNHDVQRSADSQDDVARLVADLRGGVQSIDDVLLTNPSLLLKRQENFLEFARSFAFSHAGRPYWSVDVEGPSGVRIVGLNTALLAADDNDRGRLRVGLSQFEALASGIREVTLVMMHHPPTGGWLADEQDVARWLKRLATVQLTGHVHESSSFSIVSGSGSSTVTIAAGAVHSDPSESRAAHGYNVAEVSRDDEGTLHLRVWPRLWSPENRDFRVDVHAVPEGATSAAHALRTPPVRRAPDEVRAVSSEDPSRRNQSFFRTDAAGSAEGGRDAATGTDFAPASATSAQPHERPAWVEADVWDALKQALMEGELIVFAGAGVSAAAGIPSWSALAQQLLAQMRQKADIQPGAIEEVEEAIQQSRLIDALSAASVALGPLTFASIVRKALDDEGRAVPRSAIAIAGLAGKLRGVVTTNIDRLLERAFQ